MRTKISVKEKIITRFINEIMAKGYDEMTLRKLRSKLEESTVSTIKDSIKTVTKRMGW